MFTTEVNELIPTPPRKLYPCLWRGKQTGTIYLQVGRNSMLLGIAGSGIGAQLAANNFDAAQFAAEFEAFNGSVTLTSD